MKKLTSLLLALCLAFSLAVPAFAANDVVWSKDTTLTRFINRYDNATVKAGVTLTMKVFQPDPQGLEITKSLTVEDGGTITGGGCIIFSRGATCSGLPLYYRVAGVEKPLTVTLAEVVASDPNADYYPTFLYDSATGHYVLVADFSNDPFEQPAPPTGGGANEEVTAYADGLKALGLFLGTDKGYELERTPSRSEAIVLLLRLMGKYDEASAHPANYPYDDVASWANRYVAYAFDEGITAGVGGGVFGEGASSLAQFETFVLRAMGYEDESTGGSDFSWQNPAALAQKLGIVLGPSDEANFNRGTCVRIMEIALRNRMKDGTPLWQKLVADGVFTEEAYKAAMPQ